MARDRIKGWTLAASLTIVFNASKTLGPIKRRDSSSRVERIVINSRTKTSEGSYIGLDGFAR